MSLQYRAIQWNNHKKTYDLVLAGAVVGYLALFVALGVAFNPPPSEVSPPILLIRATATLALIMLHVILAIGPLARLSDLFSPLLYNRRHLGVAFFLVALLHALLGIGFYGGFGVRDPLSALLTDPLSLPGPPWELFGLLALCVLFLMAATSHDFWLNTLNPDVWKALHMLVYLAYALVLAHVVFGAGGSEFGLGARTVLAAAALGLASLHGVAGVREWRRDAVARAPEAEGWVEVGSPLDIPDARARVVTLPKGERVAIFRDGDRLCAMTNVCAHQGGPLGEGRIVNGCVTCPWHGYQYLPHNGTSPPPYTEKVRTYRLRLEGERLLLHGEALAPGTEPPPVFAARVARKGADG